MPQKRLSKDEVNFIMKMKEMEYSNCEIGRKLGVTEGAIRYQKKRKQGPVRAKVQILGRLSENKKLR